LNEIVEWGIENSKSITLQSVLSQTILNISTKIAEAEDKKDVVLLEKDGGNLIFTPKTMIQ